MYKITLILNFILFLPIFSFAQAGSLDLNFGNNGIVISDIGPPNTNDAGSAVAIQPDGKILMAGNSTTGISLSTGMIYIKRFALTRYNTNGSLDNSFGVSGKVTTFLGNYTLYLNYLNAMALQSDGKILVAGSGLNNSVSVLIRYKNNGTLDSTFDNDGIVTTAISSASSFQSICVQPDGKIVAAGTSLSGSAYVMTVARYNSNGTLDSTFNYDGIVTTSIGNTYDVANSVILQVDGKILICGHSSNGSNFDFALVRYNTNGSLDPTFDIDGKLTTTIGTNSFAYSISLQSDGKIIAAGERENAANTCFAIARYNIDGALDSTFGTTGVITTSIGNYNDHGRAITIQSDGAILLAGDGTLTNGSSYQSAIVRYKTNGTLDSTFDNDGIVMTSFGPSGYSAGNSVVVQSNGKIIVAGMYINFSHHDFALARYNNDSALCPSVYVSQSFTICAGQIVSVGINTYAASGTYVDTLTSIVNGCDSVITTNLTILSTNILSQSLTICAGQSVSVGSNTYTLSGTYIDTITSLLSGCDSIVTTNLTVLPINSYSQSLTICDGQSVSVGSNTYILSGTYIDTLTLMLSGCDSIVTTNLTVLPINAFSQTLTICDGQSVSVGSNTYTLSGTYIDTLTSMLSGCDSIVTTNLTVLPINSFSQTLTICDGQSVSVGSNTYTSSGIYTDSLSAVNTCDSIVITNVNVNPKPLNTISINGVVITSNQNAGSYQWIDCDNGYSPITGETNQSFTASINGNYAVIVTLNGCVDTSACVQIINSGIIDQLSNNSIHVTINANPFTTSTNIQSDELLKKSTLKIYNLFGQQVKQKTNLKGHTITFYRDNLCSGVYFMELIQENKILFRSKLVIKD